MVKKQDKYFLHGNGYDTWEISTRNNGKMIVVQSFNVSSKFNELNSSAISDNKKSRLKILYYYEAKSAAEEYMRQISNEQS